MFLSDTSKHARITELFIKMERKMKTLYELKLAVINTHKGDHNTYLRASIAGDACYSSNNSIQYKMTQMMKVKQELVTLRPAEGTEVIDVTLAKKVDIFRRMQDELAELEVRFDADKKVYLNVAETAWKPYKKSLAQDVSQVMNELDDILGKDENPIQEAI